MPLITSVGSKVASDGGGCPLPLASTTGSPRSRLRADTLHVAIVSLPGGVTVAVMLTGELTRLPSAGPVQVSVGTGPVAAVTLIVTNAGADANPRRSTAT